LQIGDNFISYWLLVSCLATFHFTNLEEYYIGTMILPVFNGVSDGSVVIICFTVLTGFIGGNNFWATPLYDGSWLQISGITMMTYGQVFGFITAITHTLISLGK